MFERNRVENAAAQQQIAVPVEVRLDDGRDLVGKLFVPVNRSLPDVLNGPNIFLELEIYGAPRQFIAKSALRSVRMVSVPGASQLHNRTRDIDNFDPHTVLGLDSEASWDEVRLAYHRLAKVYHPDRYAGLELPGEVREYIAAMASRINLAYASLENVHESQRRVATRAAPVYTSRPRA